MMEDKENIQEQAEKIVINAEREAALEILGLDSLLEAIKEIEQTEDIKGVHKRAFEANIKVQQTVDINRIANALETIADGLIDG